MERWLDTSKKAEKNIDVWIDGSCEPINPGGTACGGYIIKYDGTEPFTCYFVVGKGAGMTNNVAEYHALIQSLIKIKELGLQNEFIRIRSDSDLLVKQVNRVWAVKAPTLIPLFRKAKELLTGLHYQIEWVPREKNKEADELTHIALQESLRK